MANDINYKSKYEALKLKYKNSVEMAFRLGYEQGMTDAGTEQAQQQAQQAQEQAAQAQAGGMPGQPGEEGAEGQPQEPGDIEDPTADSENPDGSELDQHIAKLESMLGKSEDDSAIKATISGLKKMKQSMDMRKSEIAIKGIAKALKTTKLTPQASHNLPDNSKKALSLQEKIVKDVMKSWEAEEKRTSKDIRNILDKE